MITLHADLHTHTIASGHAYSTISEMIDSAAEKGLELFATTDHAPAMPGSCQAIFFSNLHSLPRKMNGVTVLQGVELNVLNVQGAIDLPKGVIRRLDWVIASLHANILIPEENRDYTELYLALAENPLVDLIGHPDSPQFPFDMERVVPVLAAAGKIIEINDHHAFDTTPNALENACRLAEICARHGAMIAVNSDAHTRWEVGRTERACAMLDEIGFPEDLILNTSAARVLDFIRTKKPNVSL